MKKSFSKPKKQRKNLFLPIFIAIVLISSMVGFMWKGQEKTNYKEYKGYNFNKVNNKWVTQIKGKQVVFDYSPEELESIVLPHFNTNIDKVYIAIDPEQTDTNLNYILQKIADTFLDVGIRPVPACTKDSSNCPNIPIADCKNNDLVIQIIKSDKITIFKQDSCIILEGDIIHLNKGIDKLRLYLLGI